jgi:hypothetical protein
MTQPQDPAPEDRGSRFPHDDIASAGTESSDDPPVTRGSSRYPSKPGSTAPDHQPRDRRGVHPAERTKSPENCHNPRIADRVVFDHVAALVHRSGYERVARLGCSDRTIRRRITF